jgi:hypothetical protein
MGIVWSTTWMQQRVDGTGIRSRRHPVLDQLCKRFVRDRRYPRLQDVRCHVSPSSPSFPLTKSFITIYSTSTSSFLGAFPPRHSPGANIPIVHRIIQSHTSTVTHPNGTTTETQLMLTKGDNNPTDDLGLYHSYMRGMKWLKRDMVVGKVRG